MESYENEEGARVLEHFNFEFSHPEIRYNHFANGECLDIHIRTVQLDDAEEVFELIEANRDHLRKWLSWVDFVKTLDDEHLGIKNFIAKRQTLQNICRKSDSELVLMIELCCVIIVNNKIVGTCGYNKIVKNSTGSINIGYLGYWLDKKWEGLGIITSAVEKMVEYGFNIANLDHINISVAKENEKSLRVVNRLVGFVQMESIEDCMIVNGIRVNLMSFLRSKAKAIAGWRENRPDHSIRDDFKYYQ